MSLIKFTNKGIYCPQGDFFIDPWYPVKYAVITHGHADHARWGMKKYLCHTYTVPILLTRISPDLSIEGIDYGVEVIRNGVKISFYPAGHVVGSAQVRLEYKGEICVISGDYKLEFDGISTQFESVKCHEFVTESTFGLPIYHWENEELIFNQIRDWANQNIENGKTNVLIAYSLGKAQRLLYHVAKDFPIYVHYSTSRVNQAIEKAGIDLPKYQTINANLTKKDYQNGILIVPNSVQDSRFIKNLTNPSIGICSGWMQVRGRRRWQSVDAGFALSDHADWEGLLAAIKSSEADKVYVTHGSTQIFSKYLNEIGIESEPVVTRFGDEEEQELDTEEQNLST